MCVAIEGWAAEVGKAKRTKDLVLPPPGLDDRIRQLIGPQVSPGTGRKARPAGFSGMQVHCSTESAEL